jgi:hypothetical protein
VKSPAHKKKLKIDNKELGLLHSVIPALRRLRQEDLKFEASLSEAT